MIDIVMLSNVDWQISEKTKQSLLKFARDDRVIMEVGPNYVDNPQCVEPACDLHKKYVIETKATSDSIYILDDDDWLFESLAPVKAGFDGAIYSSIYRDEVLTDINSKRMGVGFGFVRCIYNRQWLIDAFQRAVESGITCCIDVFLLYHLGINGKWEDRRDIIIAESDKTPRTMNVRKFREGYRCMLNKIKVALEIDKNEFCI